MIERNVIIFNKHAESIQLLADEDRLKILDAILEYSLHGGNLSLPPHLNCIWIIIKDVMDHSWEKYEKRCRINREIASSRKKPVFGKDSSVEVLSQGALGVTLEGACEDSYVEDSSAGEAEGSGALEGHGGLELHRGTSLVAAPGAVEVLGHRGFLGEEASPVGRLQALQGSDFEVQEGTRSGSASRPGSAPGLRDRPGVASGSALERLGVPKGTSGEPKIIQNKIIQNKVIQNKNSNSAPHLEPLNKALEDLRVNIEKEEEAKKRKEERALSDKVYKAWKEAALICKGKSEEEFYKKDFGALRESIKRYGKDEVLQGVYNFAFVFRKKEYWIHYRCDLKGFVNMKTFESFLPSYFVLEDYRRG